MCLHSNAWRTTIRLPIRFPQNWWRRSDAKAGRRPPYASGGSTRFSFHPRQIRTSNALADRSMRVNMSKRPSGSLNVYVATEGTFAPAQYSSGLSVICDSGNLMLQTKIFTGFPMVTRIQSWADGACRLKNNCRRRSTRRGQGTGLTPRWSGRVNDKVPSSHVGARAAQLNR
jgi:hypothetical protein